MNSRVYENQFHAYYDEVYNHLYDIYGVSRIKDLTKEQVRYGFLENIPPKTFVRKIAKEYKFRPL